MIKKYELTCLISARIDEIERDTVIENISKLIKEKGGEITETNINSKDVVLGYPIKKEGGAQLVVFNFKYENPDLTDLKKEIESDQKIIRCFLRKSPSKRMIPLRRRTTKKEEKVELEDVDKKIEEIFGSVGEDKPRAKSEP